MYYYQGGCRKEGRDELEVGGGTTLFLTFLFYFILFICFFSFGNSIIKKKKSRKTISLSPFWIVLQSPSLTSIFALHENYHYFFILFHFFIIIFSSSP